MFVRFQLLRVAACAGIAICGTFQPMLFAQDKPESVQITLHPMVVPKQALKYELLPPLIDRMPGNAAVDYGKVKSEQNHFFGNDKLQEEISNAWNVPLDQLRSDKSWDKLVQKTVLDRLHRGARREYVDWQLPIRDGVFYSMLLGEVQEVRTFGRLLNANVRLCFARGETDEAIRLLQTSLAISRHVTEGETLINGLVGAANAGTALQQVQDWIQQPEAPNLYWALTSLPSPFIDMRKGYEAERAALELSFPELRELEDDNWAAKHWQTFLDQSLPELAALMSIPPDTARLALTAKAMLHYPAAIRFLRERGYSQERLERMQVPHVVMLHVMINFKENSDEAYKWFAVPYWQIRERGKSIDESIEKRLRVENEIIPLAATLLPAVRAARGASVRIDRSIAVLRVFEALRNHAAMHGNKLPAKLSDLDLPEPIDPVTGQPFVYTLNGDSAILEGPTDAGRPLRFEVRFAKAANSQN